MPDPIFIPHLATHKLTLMNPDGKPVGEIAGDKHGGIVTLCDANGAVRVTAVAAADQSGVTLHANGETALVAYVDAKGAASVCFTPDDKRLTLSFAVVNGAAHICYGTMALPLGDVLSLLDQAAKSRRPTDSQN